MIDATSSATTTAGAVQSLTGQAALGRDAFLKLLVAQLRHQDPLKPMDNTQFVAELAQFSNLEQVMGINDRLDLLAIQGRGMANTEITGLVGTRVTLRGSAVTLDGSGTAVQVGFTLDGDAETTRLSIVNAAGETVRTVDLGAQRGGLRKYTWDGKSDEGAVLPPGNYSVTVSAANDAGAPVGVLQEASGLVTAVSFDKGYPLLHLDNGLSAPVADLLKVEPSATTQP